MVAVLLGVVSLCALCWAQEESAAVDKDNPVAKTLQKCHRKEKNFDVCLKNAINSFTPFFKEGVPAYGIPPFDPFFAETTSTSRGGPSLNFKLTVSKVYEKGWTNSKVTGLKTNLAAKSLKYYQHFPEKYLQGEWEVNTNILQPLNNEGRFDLSLFNYTQVTTVRWTEPGEPFTVRIDALGCGDMKLHLTNLVGGRVLVENIMDRIINAAWRPGFEVMKPMINDLVSTAFTKIMNDGFKNFPFETLIPE